MIFKNEGQKNTTISLNDPKEDLTGQEVKTAMEEVVNKNVFTTTSGAIVGLNAARIIAKEIIQLDIV